jgi:lactoylglutathione lyase
MRIEHVALWTADLERCRAFYETWFGAKAGPLYQSASRPFRSYFLSFEDGARLEVMMVSGLDATASRDPRVGLAHLAMSVGSRDAVDSLTAKLAGAGCPVLSGPRATGDGYYESTIADPDGNVVEITE